MGQQWVTISEACHTLNISKTTLYRRIKQGKIQKRQANGRKTLCLIDVPDETKRDPGETLRQQLDEKDKQIERLQIQLEDSTHRHDTIIMQLTRQLEQSQRLLEYHQEPWYRRWFRRSNYDQSS
jgi:excisionase family DNA binding protein